MALMSRLLGQCRRPTRWLDRMVARGMNISHSEMTDWGLSHITIGKKDTILDVGCGGGGTIRKLAGIATEGKVYGIDYSEQSVRISRRTNRRLEESGHVEIRQGSVSSLPYPDAMFDLVTAVESHYFWPDLVSDMKELFRVLKPGGMLVMMGGEYKGGRYDERNEQWVELARLARAVTRARNFPNLAATKKLG
jgi:ubiquinone/menaquinone biosynthesis C-methylase UbiE